MLTLRQNVFLAIAVPIFLVLAIAWISLFLSVDVLLTEGTNFAYDLYENQIMFEKIINMASAIQISLKTQEISWQLYVANQMLSRIMRKELNIDDRFIPEIMNTERTFANQEDPRVTQLAKENQYRVSSWYNPNTLIYSDLTPLSKSNIFDSAVLDTFVRPVCNYHHYNYGSKEKSFKYLNLLRRGIAFESDASTFSMYSNTTVLILPNEIQPCPVHPYAYDVRCRLWYQYAKSLSHMAIFPPSYFLNDIKAELIPSQVICKYAIDFARQSISNLKNSILFITCFELQLEDLKQFFTNYKKDYSHQLVIDPFSLKLVFDTNSTFNTSTIFTLQGQLLDSLTNETSTNMTSFISKYYRSYIISSGTAAQNIPNELFKQQQTFSYFDAEGFEFFMIASSICIVDQKPTTSSYGSSRVVNTMQVYVFLDILSKDKLMETTRNLENKLSKQNMVNLICFPVGLVAFILYVLWISKQTAESIEKPIERLTSIFRDMNLDPSEVASVVEVAQGVHSDLRKITEIVDLFQSKDAIELYETFSNLVKLLNFTAKELLIEDPSQMLLNLNEQILFFSQFRNIGSLGICHNNIANIHYFQGRHLQALQHYENSIVLAKMQLDLYGLREDMSITKISKIQGNNMQVNQTTPRNYSFGDSYVDKLRAKSQDPGVVGWNSFQRQSVQEQSNQGDDKEGAFSFMKGNEGKQLNVLDDYDSNLDEQQHQQQHQQRQYQHSDNFQDHQSFNHLPTFTNFLNHHPCSFSHNQLQNDKDHNSDENHDEQIKQQQQQHQQQSEIQPLLQNLFNRKFNYFKCILDYYLHVSQDLSCPFHNEFLVLLQELIEISNSLDPSLGRKIILLYYLTQTQIALDLDIAAQESYSTLLHLLELKKQEEKANINVSGGGISLHQNKLGKIDEEIKICCPTLVMPSFFSSASQNSPKIQQNKKFSLDLRKLKGSFISARKREQKEKQAISSMQDKHKSAKNTSFHSSVWNTKDLVSFDSNANFLKSTPFKKYEQLLAVSKTYLPDDSFIPEEDQMKREKPTLHSSVISDQILLPPPPALSFHSPQIISQNNLILPQNQNLNPPQPSLKQPRKITLPRILKVKPPPSSSNYPLSDSQYEFPSDALSSYQALCQSAFDLKNLKYYDAGLILTDNLQNQHCFLQAARDEVLKQLNNIFLLFNLKNSCLHKEIRILNSQRIYKVVLINMCKQPKQVKQTLLLSQQLLHTILKRDDDYFGFVGFNFEENCSEALLTSMNCKLIKTNEDIIFSQISKVLKIDDTEIKVFEDESNNDSEVDKCKSNKGDIQIENSLNGEDILDSISPRNNNHQDVIVPPEEGIITSSQALYHMNFQHFGVTSPKSLDEIEINKAMVESNKDQQNKQQTLNNNSSQVQPQSISLQNNKNNSNNTDNKHVEDSTQLQITQLFHICVKNAILNYFFGSSLTQVKLSRVQFSKKKQEAKSKKINAEKEALSDLGNSQINNLYSLPCRATCNLEQLQKKTFNASNNKLSTRKYLIVTLDEELYEKDNQLDALTKFLYHHQLKLMVVQLSQKVKSTVATARTGYEEQSKKGIVIKDTEVISYFNSIEGLLQYLNNQRQIAINKHIIQSMQRY